MPQIHITSPSHKETLRRKGHSNTKVCPVISFDPNKEEIQENPEKNSFSKSINRLSNRAEGQHNKDSKPSKSDSSDGETSERPKRTNGLEGQLRTHVPLNDKFVCFNCRSELQLTGQCTQPYKVHCQDCGFLCFTLPCSIF